MRHPHIPRPYSAVASNHRVWMFEKNLEVALVYSVKHSRRSAVRLDGQNQSDLVLNRPFTEDLAGGIGDSQTIQRRVAFIVCDHHISIIFVLSLLEQLFHLRNNAHTP